MKSLVPAVALVLVPAVLLAQDPPGRPPVRPVALDVRQTSLGKPLKGIRWDSLTVSPDGKRVAYAVTKGPSKASYLLLMAYMAGVGSAQVVVDGVPGPKYNAVGDPIFSPDGSRVAYRALRGAKLETMGGYVGSVQEVVVVDGVEGPGFPSQTGGVGTPVFSPDGSRVAYRARRGKDAFVVLDNREGETFDEVLDPVFRPDGTGVAYLALRDQTVYVVNGNEVNPTRFRQLFATSAITLPSGIVANASLALSPDGRRVAYVAKQEKQAFMVIDGREAGPYDECSLPAFGADGKLAYVARKGKTTLLVTEGAEVPSAYSPRGLPVFSPDGQRLAFWAEAGGKRHLVVDGVAGPPLDPRVLGYAPSFSPDGRHVAHVSIESKKTRVGVDDAEGSVHEKSNGWLGLVSRPVFDGPDDLTYAGPLKDEIVRWEVRIVEPSLPPSK